MVRSPPGAGVVLALLLACGRRPPHHPTAPAPPDAARPAAAPAPVANPAPAPRTQVEIVVDRAAVRRGETLFLELGTDDRAYRARQPLRAATSDAPLLRATFDRLVPGARYTVRLLDRRGRLRATLFGPGSADALAAAMDAEAARLEAAAAARAQAAAEDERHARCPLWEEDDRDEEDQRADDWRKHVASAPSGRPVAFKRLNPGSARTLQDAARQITRAEVVQTSGRKLRGTLAGPALVRLRAAVACAESPTTAVPAAPPHLDAAFLLHLLNGAVYVVHVGDRHLILNEKAPWLYPGPTGGEGVRSLALRPSDDRFIHDVLAWLGLNAGARASP